MTLLTNIFYNYGNIKFTIQKKNSHLAHQYNRIAQKLRQKTLIHLYCKLKYQGTIPYKHFLYYVHNFTLIFIYMRIEAILFFHNLSYMISSECANINKALIFVFICSLVLCKKLITYILICLIKLNLFLSLKTLCFQCHTLSV